MIPREALEDAADAMQQFALTEDRDGLQPWTTYAQKALEAATPFLRAQALEDAADELDGEFTEIRRAKGKSFTWLCGIADAELHLRARAATERGPQ